MNSMTGYGRGESENASLKIIIEAKAVNHRFCEITIKQPRQLLALEEKMKKVVSEYMERGKMDIFVRIQEQTSKEKPVQIDQAKAAAYHQAMKELSAQLKIPYEIDAYQLCHLPDVLVHQEEETDVKSLWPLLEAALRQALEQHAAMRRTEGAYIQADLKEKIHSSQTLVKQVAERSPVILAAYQEKLHARIAELMDTAEVDPERLAQEVAYFAVKSCIDEELVRLNSHLAQFLSIMDLSGGIGRKLDFLTQEMNREANTIGSKANDLEMGRLVVEIKSQLEKIREQVQNIE